MALTSAWQREPEQDEPVRPVTALRRPAPTPRAVAAPPARTGLRLWKRPRVLADVFWVGAHGGAGESTLAAAMRRTAATEHRWPDPDPDAPQARAVLVARTSAAGLAAAQAALAQWDAGLSGHCQLLGLVLSADAPGRKTPRPLRELAHRIAGGAPRVWELPWIEEWRLHPGAGPPPMTPPVARLLAEVADLAYPRH